MSHADTSAEIVPYAGEHSEDELDLFGPYRHLVAIVVEGRRFTVPEANCVLRALQYLEMKERAVRMPWRDYCWNNTVGCCEMTYRARAGEPARQGRACQILATPGMEIVQLPKGGRSCAPRR